MKVLIWVLCILVYSLITMTLQVCGLQLGGIPTVILAGGTFWLARMFCRKWDDRKSCQAIMKMAESEKQPVVEKISFCRKCGEELSQNAQFCRKCGTEVVKENTYDLW